MEVAASTTEKIEEEEGEKEMTNYKVTVKKKKKKKSKKCNKPDKVQSTEKLLKQAQLHIDRFEYEEAARCLKKILCCEPNNLEALDSLAGLFIETRDFDQAHNLLLKIIELRPDGGYGSYFTLAQISEGEESLHYYKRGIQILERLLCDEGQSTEVKNHESLRKDLTEAYCSIAEIYMTDLCDDDNAEEQCRFHINKSLECGPEFPEGHQCLASFLLILQKKEESKEAVTKSLSFWLPRYRAAREGQTENSDDEPFLVNYDFRINTCKILIELEMYDEASEILDGLIEENDSVLETWYLLGLLNYSRGEAYWENARYYFKKALKLKEIGVPHDPEQISQVESCLTEMGPGSDGEEDENEENEAVDDNVDFPSDLEEEMES
ncbi:probable assembly chaperone of rpl4 [Centruroides sculpturatus]|uniref:probable assembly chaperone of rpl4 n=1 Tax=Centruroides sculpturatus TaxID=218467 RepID=UPI000C6C9BE2|nr:probable assembly chaperone of rpl4 [Centruroides sculpturatus]